MRNLIPRAVLLGLAVGGVACGEPAPEADPALSDVGGSSGATLEAPPVASAQDPDTIPADTSSLAWTAGVTSAMKPVSGIATVAATRFATHDAFDRFVIQIAGAELPAYHLEYVDRPVRQCGSGEPVPIAGDGWLLVRLEPAQAHDDQGRPTLEERASEPRLPNLLEIRLICDFEGQVEWVLGVGSPNEYRVTELEEPTRLVVDVRN